MGTIGATRRPVFGFVFSRHLYRDDGRTCGNEVREEFATIERNSGNRPTSFLYVKRVDEKRTRKRRDCRTCETRRTPGRIPPMAYHRRFGFRAANRPKRRNTSSGVRAVREPRRFYAVRGVYTHTQSSSLTRTVFSFLSFRSRVTGRRWVNKEKRTTVKISTIII